MSLDITPAVGSATQIIQAYGDGGFRIASESYTGSVIVLAEQTLSVQVASATDLTTEALAPITSNAADIDILVVGCGETFSRPDAELRARLKDYGIVMEWMDTGAACRTFNVLMTEGRRAAAILIAIANETA